MKYLIILSIILLSYGISGAELKKIDGGYQVLNNEIKFIDLLKEYAKITKRDLIIDGVIKNYKYSISGKKVIKEDQMRSLLSAISLAKGLSIIFKDDVKQIILLRARNIRYQDVELYTEEDKVPKTHSYARFIYKAKYLKAAALIRNIRPFMSRYGRATAIKSAEQIVLNDTAKNIKRIISIFKRMDTSAAKKSVEKMKEKNEEFAKIGEASESSLKNVERFHILFIVLFSLISLIIGFSFRGFVIRRIEGGL